MLGNNTSNRVLSTRMVFGTERSDMILGSPLLSLGVSGPGFGSQAKLPLDLLLMKVY